MRRLDAALPPNVIARTRRLAPLIVGLAFVAQTFAFQKVCGFFLREFLLRFFPA